MTRQSKKLVGLLVVLIGTIAGSSSVALADPPGAVREVNEAIMHADREAVRLLHLLDETRRARNVPQIACVDSQLSQVNSFHRLLELRRERVREALARGDTARVAHERRVVRRVVGQLRHVARAGRACVYPPAGQADRTVVEVTISSEIQDEDLDPPPARP